ncbi:MAG: RNA-binding protein [Alphaproteobacteria bacterium]
MNKHHYVTKFVVRNLSPSMTAEKLNRIFAEYGVVQSVRLTQDVMTGRCGGLGFVSLDETVTGTACDALDGSRHGGRVIRVALERKS